MRLETVLLDRVGAVVIDRHRQEVVLDVRPVELLPGTDEATGFELVAGADPGAGEQPLRTDRRLVPPLQRRVQRDRLLAGVLHVHLQVVLQVLADAGQVVHQWNAEGGQQCRRAHAGALQDLRRGDRTGAQQHLAACGGVDRLGAVAGQVAHAHRALAGEQDAVGGGVHHDLQPLAVLGHVQVTARSTGAAPARGHRAVHRAEAFLLVAVEVVGARVARLHPGLDHRVEQHVVAVLRRGHADRAVAAVIIVGADVARFRLAEVGQHVVVAPVLQAVEAGPLVEVHRVAADVAHAVDQRGTAQALAAAALHAPVVHVGFRLGFIRPVVAPALQRVGQCGRHLGAEIHPVIRPAGFQQQHADAGVFGEARGQRVAGRTGADDDVVVLALHRGVSW